jgi:dipeptidyl aminopeptidase/acylaminoacyl peptidase
MGDSSGQQFWQSPPQPINQTLDNLSSQGFLLCPNQEWMVELEKPQLLPITTLAQPEIAVAGFRLNPKTNGPAGYHPYNSIHIKNIKSGISKAIELPQSVGVGFFKWAPDGTKLAFALTKTDGVELWILDIAKGLAEKITEGILNSCYGVPFRWLDNNTLVCKVIPSDRGPLPEKSETPIGPIIQENFGKKSPNRTFTNLLENTDDEILFEYYVKAALELITLDGKRTQIVEPSLIDAARPSPDGQYILLKTLHRPYSYQLPASYFPKKSVVINRDGQLVYEVEDLPLADNLSIKFEAVRVGRRKIYWRLDRPSSLYWLEALDEGDPTKEVEYRDALFTLDAPFTQQPQQIWCCQYRYRGIVWGRDDCAVVVEGWYDTRHQRIWKISPNQPETTPKLLIERSTEDKYADPGTPLTIRGEYQKNILRFSPDGQSIYLRGRGASPQGVYPFLDKFHLDTKQKQRLWQCQDPYLESVVEMLEDEESLITYRQSKTDAPNFYLHSPHNPPVSITNFPDPAPEFAGIHKEVVQYQRTDGVKLSAKLYLPPTYNPETDGPLPTLFWVYPAEFKSAELAGQVTTAENSFTRPGGSSILFLLTQGYAILDDPKVPIIGEGNVEPNDTYVEQLTAGLEAAVDYLVSRGISDRDRLGIGGHSYGAFTTANALAHTNFFKVGIARSGAYNRSLTPFGFQGEQRNYWEATETYIKMSPFTYAEKIKAPLLLIHGVNDSNPGTYPLQTERLYEAIKGLGGIARWVQLPLEDHGYRSREAIGHVLWEIIQWCDKYLKGI